MINCKDSVVEVDGDDKELCLDIAQILRALHSRFFSDWKSGRSVPKIEKLKKIADCFGVTVDYFLE